jgi:hypothetical protein
MRELFLNMAERQLIESFRGSNESARNCIAWVAASAARAEKLLNERRKEGGSYAAREE